MVARAAGINKALIYRAFDSKEELFVLTVADYLTELEAGGGEDGEFALARISDSTGGPSA